MVGSKDGQDRRRSEQTGTGGRNGSSLAFAVLASL